RRATTTPGASSSISSTTAARSRPTFARWDPPCRPSTGRAPTNRDRGYSARSPVTGLTVVAHDDARHLLARRRGRLLPPVAEKSAAAAIGRVLQLHQETVRISEVQLRRPVLRAAAVLHPHRDVVAQRPDRPGGPLARLDPVALERLDDLVRLE